MTHAKSGLIPPTVQCYSCVAPQHACTGVEEVLKGEEKAEDELQVFNTSNQHPSTSNSRCCFGVSETSTGLMVPLVVVLRVCGAALVVVILVSDIFEPPDLY